MAGSALLLTSVPAAVADPTVTWPEGPLSLRESATATVAGGSVPAGATVRVQRKFPDRWRDAGPSATAAGKRLTLRLPTDQLGTFTFRVVSDQDGGTVTSSAAQVTVRPTYDPAGSADQHAFLTSPRWQWDSCGAIRWVFNPNASPGRALKQVKGAFRRVHEATGLEFVYGGTTTARPTTSGRDLPGKAKIVVGWRRAKAFARQTGNRDAVGVGGAAYSTGWRLPAGPTVHRAVSGGVVLNARYNDRLDRGFGAGHTWGEVLMHELGHVVGLNHVGARKQVMYGTTTDGKARWGAGDLAGLAKVGDRGGCLVRDTARSTGLRTTSAF